MRSKECTRVLRLDVIALLPKPEVHIAYDGLAGLTQRPILRDIVGELARKGPKDLETFIAAVKRKSATVLISYTDYVSYGIGGGDATAEFPWPRTMLMWYEKERPSDGGVDRNGFITGPVPEHLVLRRRLPILPAQEQPEEQNQVERLSLERLTP